MFTSRSFKALLLLAASLLFLHAHTRAQSGRTPQRPKTLPGMQPEPAPTPVDYARYDGRETEERVPQVQTSER